MRCGLPVLAPKYNSSNEQLQFANGLIELMNGKIDKSSKIFQKLYLNSSNNTVKDTVKDNSKIILSQLLIYNQNGRNSMIY